MVEDDSLVILGAAMSHCYCRPQGGMILSHVVCMIVTKGGCLNGIALR